MDFGSRDYCSVELGTCPDSWIRDTTCREDSSSSAICLAGKREA